jgi:hypothetical protein
MKTIHFYGLNFQLKWLIHNQSSLAVPIGVCILLFAGCKSTYQNYPLAEEPSQPRIVIVRKTFESILAPMKIYQNGQFIGRLGAGRRYLAWQPKPGEVFLEATIGFNRMTYRIDAQPGKSYYLMASIGFWSFSNPLKLRETPADQVPDLGKMKKPRINFSR